MKALETKETTKERKKERKQMLLVLACGLLWISAESS
jgi:hypothetical protein